MTDYLSSLIIETSYNTADYGLTYTSNFNRITRKACLSKTDRAIIADIVIVKCTKRTELNCIQFVLGILRLRCLTRCAGEFPPLFRAIVKLLLC